MAAPQSLSRLAAGERGSAEGGLGSLPVPEQRVVVRRHVAVLEALLSADADPHKADEDSNTPLMAAAEGGGTRQPPGC